VRACVRGCGGAGLPEDITGVIDGQDGDIWDVLVDPDGGIPQTLNPIPECSICTCCVPSRSMYCLSKSPANSCRLQSRRKGKSEERRRSNTQDRKESGVQRITGSRRWSHPRVRVQMQAGRAANCCTRPTLHYCRFLVGLVTTGHARTYTHCRTRARTHARTRAHMHTRTHTHGEKNSETSRDETLDADGCARHTRVHLSKTWVRLKCWMAYVPPRPPLRLRSPLPVAHRGMLALVASFRACSDAKQGTLWRRSSLYFGPSPEDLTCRSSRRPRPNSHRRHVTQQVMKIEQGLIQSSTDVPSDIRGAC